MPRPPRFTIRAASALTGINQNTLRAWERRHGLVRPERTPKGYRLYSDEDIERLRLIRRALQEGVSVGHVREYLETPGTAEHLLQGASPTTTRAPRHAAGAAPGRAAADPPVQAQAHSGLTADERRLAELSAQMERAARQFDRQGLEQAFCRAVGMFSVRQAFHQGLMPALRSIGRGDAGGPGDATERFLTAFARERLMGVLAGLRPLHQQPRALFACLPGEQHEAVMMLQALEVGLDGVSALYLGAAVPVETVRKAASETGARAVVASATLGLPRETILDLRDQLAALPRRPRLLVGGPAARANLDWLGASGCEVLEPDPVDAAAQVLRAINAE